MLTLAGLAYRGSLAFGPGEPHDLIVRRAVLAGLQTLPPVRDDWELVWGPVTSRLPLGVFDSSAMYVVRNRRARHRYVVAIRGTNPVASSDWLFGDFLVATTVAWPYATDATAISTSTALGLAMLQDMRARPPSTAARFAEASSQALGDAFERLVQSGRARLRGSTDVTPADASSLAAQVERIVAHWNLSQMTRDRVWTALRRDAAARLNPADLRRTVRASGSADGGLDLLSFLKAQAAEGADALEVVVTGHSKGGALAPTVALWLVETLDSRDPEERWDPRQRAQVSCHAFAGPTPGNAAFAERIDRRLGKQHHHVRNMNDLVTRAWQVDDLAGIPSLYRGRDAGVTSLVPDIIAAVEELNYRHAQAGVVTFAGGLDPARPFAAELIHQHLEAYLEALKLSDEGIHAVTFFL